MWCCSELLAVSRGSTRRESAGSLVAGLRRGSTPGSEGIALLCLLVVAFALTGLVAWVLAGAVRPITPFLVTGGLCLCTVGALTVAAVIFWHHRLRAREGRTRSTGLEINA